MNLRMWQNLLRFIIFPLKHHVQLFLCLLVIFQGILIVPHLQNNCQKQMLFLNNPVRQWRLSFILCFQVLMTVSVCLFNQLYN
jgi:hypothetical protein